MSELQGYSLTVKVLQELQAVLTRARSGLQLLEQAYGEEAELIEGRIAVAAACD